MGEVQDRKEAAYNQLRRRCRAKGTQGECICVSGLCKGPLNLLSNSLHSHWVPGPSAARRRAFFRRPTQQVGVMVPFPRVHLGAQRGMVPCSETHRRFLSHKGLMALPCTGPFVPPPWSDNLQGSNGQGLRLWSRCQQHRWCPRLVPLKPGSVPDDATPTRSAGFEAASSVTGQMPGPQGSTEASSPTVPRRPGKGCGCGLSFVAWHFFPEPSREGTVGVRGLGDLPDGFASEAPGLAGVQN